MIFMERSRNIPIFNIPGMLFWNISRNFLGNFLRIFRKYIMGMFAKYSTNIYLLDGLRACEKFTGQKYIYQFIRNKPKFVEPVQFNLGVDKDNKSDSIQYMPILSTLKVLLKHEDILGSVLDQENDKEGNGRLRTYKDGTACRSNEFFSLDKNSFQLVLYHDFGNANLLANIRFQSTRVC